MRKFITIFFLYGLCTLSVINFSSTSVDKDISLKQLITKARANGEFDPTHPIDAGNDCQYSDEYGNQNGMSAVDLPCDYPWQSAVSCQDMGDCNDSCHPDEETDC